MYFKQCFERELKNLYFNLSVNNDEFTMSNNDKENPTMVKIPPKECK